MPPKAETEREAVLDAVMDIIEEKGFDAVSARSVAARLGISTQPIYRLFGDMDAVRRAALERGYELFERYVSGAALDQAASYVSFAVTHGKLFNFLFRGRNACCNGLDELATHLLSGTGIIPKLGEITGLSGEKLYRLHLGVWMALHGLAVMAADNGSSFTDDEIKQFTVEITRALGDYYRKE